MIIIHLSDNTENRNLITVNARGLFDKRKIIETELENRSKSEDAANGSRFTLNGLG